MSDLTTVQQRSNEPEGETKQDQSIDLLVEEVGQNAEFKVQVDFNRLTWGELRDMQKLNSGEATNADAIEQLVNRVLVGQTMADIPLAVVGRLVKHIMRRVGEITNPN